MLSAEILAWTVKLVCAPQSLASIAAPEKTKKKIKYETNFSGNIEGN